MKAVIQRVRSASVSAEGKITGSINSGLLVYLGIADGDNEKDAIYLTEKISNLRIFNDENDKMNLSILDLCHSKNIQPSPLPGILVISQFTLLAETKRGRRPYYGNAADPEIAKELYVYFLDKFREMKLHCEEGIFQAKMDVSYTNEGPVTIILDSRDYWEKTGGKN